MTAVDELEGKGRAFHMEMEADPVRPRRFADAVFDAVLHKREEEQRRDRAIAEIAGKAEAYLQPVPKPHFFQRYIVLQTLYLLTQGNHGIIAFIEDIAKQGRKLEHGFGRFRGALERHRVEAVEGIEEKMRMELGPQQLEFDGELFFFQPVLDLFF